MSTRKREPWEPNWADPPGETVREALRERGLTQERAAELMGVSAPYLNGVIRGHRAITARVALRLEKVTGVRAEVWARLWAQYAVAVERRRTAA